MMRKAAVQMLRGPGGAGWGGGGAERHRHGYKDCHASQSASWARLRCCHSRAGPHRKAGGAVDCREQLAAKSSSLT